MAVTEGRVDPLKLWRDMLEGAGKAAARGDAVRERA